MPPDRTFRFLIVPRRSAQRLREPRFSRNWWREFWQEWGRLIATVTALIVLIAGGTVYKMHLASRIDCRPGLLPADDVWKVDGECVGTSEGPYAFGLPELEPVMRLIAEQNRRATTGGCAKDRPAVTIGALMTLTSDNIGGRVLHQLEGIAAAQALANEDPQCLFPVRVQVGQIGGSPEDPEDAAEDVAGRMAEDVVAVTGMGLSEQRTVAAADVLASQPDPIPMVGNVITAEGFDRNGSKVDSPDFSACSKPHLYQGGVGKGYFYRVSYRNAVQITRLAEYFAREQTKFDFIMTPIGRDDPYTCTTLPLLHRRFGNDVGEVRFDTSDEATVSQSARRICLGEGNVHVLYAARSRDLPRFLQILTDQADLGQCRFDRITVASLSDAARMRSQETDLKLEGQRTGALNTRTFKNGRVQLVFTPLADPHLSSGSVLGRLQQKYKQLRKYGFEPGHLDSGWAINGHDGLATIATALNAIVGPKVTPARVNTAIGSFAKGGKVVPGAGGNITFDNYGNRDDSLPYVVRLCPSSDASATSTVQVYPKQGKCP